MVDSILSTVQLIIPITGNGARFKAAGIEKLKPFIKVHNHSIVEWVLKMFPGTHGETLFICRNEHLEDIPYVREELTHLAPKANIVSIKNWEKKGPAFDILRASNYIDDNKPVVVSYCDYYMQWNYLRFIQEAVALDVDGAVPCYTGFHPHLLRTENIYASCRVDEHYQLIEIKEKHSWCADKTRDLHSPGVYYFKSGAMLKKYIKLMIEHNDMVNGEFYVSLPFNYMKKDNLNIWCPPIVEKFCQWGTPEDLSDYLVWSI